MATWSFTLAPGGDITSLVDVTSIVRTRRLFTELRPNVNKLEFRVEFSSSLFSTLISNNTIEIAVTKDGSAYFTGVLSPNYKAQVRDGRKFISIIAEDYTLSRLGKTVAAPVAYAGFAVCTPAATSTSLVHAIATAAGVTLATSLPTISTTVPYVVALPDDRITWGTLLANILFEYGYVYQFDPDGKMSLAQAVNTGTISTTGTLTTAAGTANIRGELEIEKRPERYDDIRIKYDLVEQKTGIVLFQDTTGATDSAPCTIPLAATGDSAGKDYYPLTSKVGEVFSAWNSPDGYSIWVATSATLDVTIESGIVADRALTNYYRKCSFSYKNTSGSVKNITKLRITGNAYVLTSKNVARSSIASAKSLFEYEAKYIFDDTTAQTLAKGIAQYYLYSDITYTVRSKDAFTLGQYVLVADAVYSGLSNKCRVIGAVENEAASGVIEYHLEAVADFVAITVGTEGESVPVTVEPPGTINPPTNNVTNVDFEESQNADGSVRVTATWSYTQGTNPADAAFIYYKSSITGAPAAFDYAMDAAAAKAMTASGTYSWSGNFPGRTGGTGGAALRWSFGIVAAKGAILHASGAVSETGWDDKTLVPIIQDIDVDLYDKAFRAYTGQGVQRRAVQIGRESVDWVDVPDTSPATPERLRARIGRLGVGESILLDGKFNAEITATISSETTLKTGTSYFPAYRVDSAGDTWVSYGQYEKKYSSGAWGSESTTTSDIGGYKFAYLSLQNGEAMLVFDHYTGASLRYIKKTSGTWGSVQTIRSTSGWTHVSGIQTPDGAIRIAYQEVGAGNPIYEIIDTGSGFGSPVTIVSTSTISAPSYAYTDDGVLRISYIDASGYLVEKTYSSGWGSASAITSAASTWPTYFVDLDGLLSVAYRRGSDGYIVSKTHTTSWSAETVLNSASSTAPALAQDLEGTLRLAYTSTALVERTLQRYAQIGAGIIESGLDSAGKSLSFGDGTEARTELVFSTIPVRDSLGNIRVAEPINASDCIPIGLLSVISATSPNIIDRTNTITYTNASYTKKREHKIKVPGTYYVSFNLYTAGTGTAYGRIYVNGVAVGTQQSNGSVTPTSFFENITLNAGDLLQLYCYRTTGTAYNALFRAAGIIIPSTDLVL
jgi:hypothetical protein